MKKEIHISYQKRSFDLGKIRIPGSKSESNRALLLNALCKTPGKIKNLSSARDTELMQSLLQSTSTIVDVKDAGTVMRFLTTYYSLTNQSKQITGTARMKERPIGLLVDALTSIGAVIKYSDQEGFPPLIISGYTNQLTDTISIDGSISSQYLSSLLMLAPILTNGLTLNVHNGATSKPYLLMTIELMNHFGVEVAIADSSYKVIPSQYTFNPFTVEPDWSSASYWYSIFVLSGAEKLQLEGFKENSLQGDRTLVELMEPFGINTAFTAHGAVLTKQPQRLPETIDFIDNPDLAQTFAVLCTALEHQCIVTGLRTLKIKETDRIAALKYELQKLGADFIEEKDQWTIIPPKDNWKLQSVMINTYHDHRMAMAFAPLSCVLPKLIIDDHEVIEKSYPSFWRDLELAGFKIDS